MDSAPGGGPRIEIVQLLPDAWERARQIRLRSLADAPAAFASTYERDAALSGDEWRRRLGRSLTLVALDGVEPVGPQPGRTVEILECRLDAT